MHTEWIAEIDMAKSMIDSALSNFNQQAKQAGSIPVEVGQAFSDGKGFEHNGEFITVGTFFRSGEFLTVVNPGHTLTVIREQNIGKWEFRRIQKRLLSCQAQATMKPA